MFEEKLSEIFRAPGVDPDELCQLLLLHFGSGHGEGVRTLVFSRSTEPALKLTFNRAGLAQIISCPALTPDDVDAICNRVEHELLVSNGIRVGTVVLFAARPVDGYF